MNWLYLFLAGILEIGWPVGLKMAQDASCKWGWIGFSVVTMALSGYFLFLAQKQIPIGTAYAVWTGIGAAGTFCIGILFFHDAVALLRCLGVLLIISGVILLKIAH
ncbi:MAG: multidrug efflux SMR transporter [Planctomycetia bacterium]|nr:multidrug efflux SMR transporter [Planctomycetia bacterium]